MEHPGKIQAQPEALERVPVKLRGLFFKEVCRFAEEKDLTSDETPKKYRAFLYYNFSDLLKLIDGVASQTPAPEEAKFEMGLKVYQTFETTTLGVVALGPYGSDVPNLIRAFVRVSAKLCNPIQLSEVTSGDKMIQFRLGHCEHTAHRFVTGILQGMLDHIGANNGKVTQTEMTANGCTYCLSWEG